MAEPFQTLREVGVALDAFRSEVSGQFTTIKWIMGGAMALGVVVAGMLFSKVDRLEEIAARNTAILERIEEKMDRVASDTGLIREKVQTVSAVPNAESFPGWVGLKADEPERDEVIETLFDNEGWIFLPER